MKNPRVSRRKEILKIRAEISAKETIAKINKAKSWFFWRRKRQPTPVFLPGKSHGQRSLVDSSSWGHKELDTTE